MTFGSQLDLQFQSYYTNLTGFWRGDVEFHNLTDLQSNATAPLPIWHHLAEDLVANANLTNATEFTNRLGSWNWTRSDKVAISLGYKLMWTEEEHNDLSRDIAMIHVSLVLRVRLAQELIQATDRERSTSQPQRLLKN